MSDAAGFEYLLDVLGREVAHVGVQGSDTPFRLIRVPRASAAMLLNEAEQRRWNLWLEVQPSKFQGERGRSSAGDVTAIRAVYADIDFKAKPQGMGSLNAATELLDDIVAAVGVAPFLTVYSGHGIQPWWLVEGGDITDENREEMAGLLRRWGAFVQTLAAHAGGHVDSVFDLPRILRIPGSTNYKSPDKPVPTYWDASKPIPVTVDELRAMLDDREIPDVEEFVATGAVSLHEDWAWAESDCSFVQIIADEVASSNPGARHQWLLKQAAVIHGMVRNGCLTEATYWRLRQAISDRAIYLAENVEPRRQMRGGELSSAFRWGLTQAEGWSDGKLSQEVRSHVHDDFLDAVAPVREPVREPSVAEMIQADLQAAYDAAVLQQQYQSPNPPTTLILPDGSAFAEDAFAPEPPQNVISITTGQPVWEPPVRGTVQGNLALEAAVKQQQRMGPAGRTDTGNAERLAQYVHGRLIHVPGIGWHAWKNGAFVRDSGGAIIEEAKDLFMAMLAGATEPAGQKWALASLNQGKLSAAIALASSLPYLSVDASRLDGNGYELNTPGGIVNLRTGEVRGADPRVDWNAKSTAVTLSFSDPHPKWTALLRDALGDQERIDYLQRLLGAACVGELIFQVFPILTGAGANGKSTIMDVVRLVLGPYAIQLPKNFLVEKKGEQHPTEMANLQGARIATASEVPASARFDEVLVKTLTGESMLTGRYMRQDFFQFPNRATIIMVSNHLPSVPAGGYGFFRRVRRIDFRNIIPEHRRNERLAAEIFEEEGSAVLGWLVRGAMEALSGGLRDIDDVRSSNLDYQLDEDAMARFVAFELKHMPGIEVDRGLVYDRYKLWMLRQGLQPLSQAKMAREVISLVPESNVGSSTVFTNLSLVQHGYDGGYGAPAFN